MSKSNLAASIRQRLKRYAKEHGESFNLILVRYGLERLLFRITQIAPDDLFVLKGGALFYCWTEKMHRPTRDIDLLCKGEPSPERFRNLFSNIMNEEVEDGLVFDSKSLNVITIKDDQKYSGIRVSLLAHLENVRINLQIDVGFGDATIPTPEFVDYPVLLDLPSPRIRAYKKETVIAEKLQALVDLGIANSRMKDFFDLWTFARDFEFDGAAIVAAIQATFDRRETPIPSEAPLALTAEFSSDEAKQKQWMVFAKKLDVELRLDEATALIEEFLMPCLDAISAKQTFDYRWRNREWAPVGQ